METYVCEFELQSGKRLNYRTVQLKFEYAQAAFWEYCRKNRFEPLSGWRWRKKGEKKYLN